MRRRFWLLLTLLVAGLLGVTPAQSGHPTVKQQQQQQQQQQHGDHELQDGDDVVEDKGDFAKSGCASGSKDSSCHPADEDDTKQEDIIADLIRDVVRSIIADDENDNREHINNPVESARISEHSSDESSNNNHEVENEKEGAMNKEETELSSSSNNTDLLNSLPKRGKVFLLDSLHQLQQILKLQQQQQQQPFNDENNETNHDDRPPLEADDDDNDAYLSWLVYLETTDATCSFSLWPIVEEVADRLSQNDQNDNSNILFFSLTLAVRDMQLLQQQFGLKATPAILLVSSTPATPASYIMVEYTGQLGTADQLYQGVTHYFDSLRLTTTTNTAKQQQEDQERRSGSRQRPPSLDLQPRQFPSLQDLDDFLLAHPRFLRHSTPTVVLSQTKSTAIERAYVQWLMATDPENEPQAEGFTRLLVQCRRSQQQQQPPSSLKAYHDFEVFARTQTSRRDHLFLLVVSDEECETERVDVWEILAARYYHDSDGNNINNNKDQQPFWKDPSVPHFRHVIAMNDDDDDDDDKQEHDEYGLVNFLVNICTDVMLWWDRQTVAPIAFGQHRKVHAVLFVDMNHKVMTVAERFVENQQQQLQDNDAMMAKGDGDSLLLTMEQHNLLRMQRTAVRQFRAACRQHRRTLHDDNAILERDMVCLVVPSTEIRVLSTLGIDWWSPLDRAATANASDETVPSSNREQLPALLITDQRYGGTRRYYYDDKDQSYEGFTDFIESFWQGRLQYAIKTSPRKSHTNQAGVRILTVESIGTELFSNGNEQEQWHALILFTAPTCGHCKRFLVIWNHLASLLRHIGWNKFLTLYQVDVTENDVATALNVTVRWLPDVNYLGSSSSGEEAAKKLIRYNHTDAVGDGVGAVRDSIEILEWLVHLDEFADPERASQLFSNLNHPPREEA